MSEMPNPLTQDAANRALRTFLVALVAELFISVWPVVVDALNGPDPVNWSALGLAAIRLTVMSAGSFIMRRLIDPSRIPSPLPPTRQTQPTTRDPAP